MKRGSNCNRHFLPKSGIFRNQCQPHTHRAIMHYRTLMEKEEEIEFFIRLFHTRVLYCSTLHTLTHHQPPPPPPQKGMGHESSELDRNAFCAAETRETRNSPKPVPRRPLRHPFRLNAVTLDLSHCLLRDGINIKKANSSIGRVHGALQRDEKGRAKCKRVPTLLYCIKVANVFPLVEQVRVAFIFLAFDPH